MALMESMIGAHGWACPCCRQHCQRHHWHWPAGILSGVFAVRGHPHPRLCPLIDAQCCCHCGIGCVGAGQYGCPVMNVPFC
jgi:hypothetical protein